MSLEEWKAIHFATFSLVQYSGSSQVDIFNLEDSNDFRDSLFYLFLFIVYPSRVNAKCMVNEHHIDASSF